MRTGVGLLAAGAVIASSAWRAALPPPPVEDRGLPASAVPEGAFPKEIVDPLGRRATLGARPSRIVSLALSDDEILLSLVPPERLAGLTYLVDDPSSTPAAGLVPASVARVTEEDPEEILSLRPDLVVSAGYTHGDAIVTLESAGVPVVGTGAHATLDDVLAAVGTLGRAVGEEGRARDVDAALRARIEAVEAGARGRGRPRVLVWEEGFTYGAGTIADDLVRRAGARNVAAEAGLRGAVSLTEEAATGLSPDIVVVPIDGREPRPRAPELLGDAPVWKAVEAVRRGEVYGLPRAWLGSVSLPAVRGLEALAEVLDARRR